MSSGVTVSEEVYHSYEGENSQRHLEESRLNLVSQLNWAMRGGEVKDLERKIRKRDEERG